jgi:hypothetical protein
MFKSEHLALFGRLERLHDARDDRRLHRVWTLAFEAPESAWRHAARLKFNGHGPLATGANWPMSGVKHALPHSPWRKTSTLGLGLFLMLSGSIQTAKEISFNS